MSLRISIPVQTEPNISKSKNILKFNNLIDSNLGNSNLYSRLKMFNLNKNNLRSNQSIISTNYTPLLQMPNIRSIRNISINNSVILNNGGYSNIYQLNNKMILKIIKKSTNNLTEFKAVLLNFYLQKIRSEDVKYICRIEECGLNGRLLYCIMENGGKDLIKLREILMPNTPNTTNTKNTKNTINKPTLLLLLNIFLECSKALNFIHKCGYVHLDVKPDNFLINFREDGSFQIKIIDFGNFHKIGDNIKEAKGTPAYMNKLILSNFEKNYTPIYDIYSLGLTFINIYFAIIHDLPINLLIKDRCLRLFYKMTSPNIKGNSKNTMNSKFDFLINEIKKLENSANILSQLRYSSLDEVIDELDSIIRQLNSL